MSLSWSKSAAKGFPVHSYRVQRRAVSLHATSSVPSSTGNVAATTDSPSRFGSNENVGDQALICDAAIDASHSYFPTCDDDCEASFAEEYAVVCAASDAATPVYVAPSSATTDSKPPTSIQSSWVAVYRGADNEFVDSTLKDGHTSYVYRVQAWNLLARAIGPQLISRGRSRSRAALPDQSVQAPNPMMASFPVQEGMVVAKVLVGLFFERFILSLTSSARLLEPYSH